MNARDKAILTDLTRFRCLTRDHVSAIHFQGLKRPITQANMVLKRLRRDRYLSVSMERRKYVYFPAQSTMKRDSSKIPHFLALADFYVAVREIEKPIIFEVETKLGDEGLPEPDVFMIWRGYPFFVEVQRSQISEKEMAAKLKRYKNYFLSDKWEDLPWQPKNQNIFPTVWLLSDQRYRIEKLPFALIQTKTVDEIRL